MKNIFGEEYSTVPKQKKKKDPVAESWKDSFHRWALKQYMDEHDHYGMCSFGAICDYCEDNSYGRPCVRALTEFCKTHYKSIDFTNKSHEYFEKCFDGNIE